MLKYRVVLRTVKDDDGVEQFIASCPELKDVEAQGASRIEAIEALEADLEDRVDDLKRSGVKVAPPIDGEEFDGRIELNVSKHLHKDLLVLAKSQGVELEALLTEILSRCARSNSPSGGQRKSSQSGSKSGGRSGGSRRRNSGSGSRGNGGGGNTTGLMDNRAGFIDYVRRNENGTTKSSRPRGGRKRRGGGQGGNGGRSPVDLASLPDDIGNTI